MRAPKRPDRIEARIDQTAHLVSTGAHVLLAMLDGDRTNGKPIFQKWAEAIRAIPGLDEEVTTNHHLTWLWDRLRTAPDLKERFAAVAARRQKDQRVDICQPGEWFAIGMKAGEVAELLQRRVPAQVERVAVEIRQPLRMKPGKADRLECCDCKADVMIRAKPTSCESMSNAS